MLDILMVNCYKNSAFFQTKIKTTFIIFAAAKESLN